MLEILILLSVFVAPATSSPQDPVRAVRAAAERAAFRYEALLRRRAPERLGGGGGRCDEVIGRFCFRFGGDSEPDPPPEHPEMAAARQRAVSAYRAWVALAPEDPGAVGPLLRFLVEDGRAEEAVALARTHAWAAGRSAGSLMLLGMALHHAAEFAASEAVFDSVRAAIDPEERARLDDVEVLLEPEERRVYRRLGPEERDAYHHRFWAFADPSVADEGNERRSAHYARHAWAAILEEAPRVRGTVSWGSDTEEILIRYGRPVGRERIRQPAWYYQTDLSMIEIFDPRAVSLVPARLVAAGLADEPIPGIRPELERDTVRSAYTPVRRPHTEGLSVQAARFQEGGGARFLVAGVLRPDTSTPDLQAPRGLLVVTDTLGQEVTRGSVTLRLRDGAALALGETTLEPGSYVYRLELVDDSAGVTGLAQHRVNIPIPTPPGLSDIVLAHLPTTGIPASRDGLEPSPDLVFAPGDSLLVWVEAAGLGRVDAVARFAVEWTAEPAEPGPALVRALGWLRERIGLGGDDPVGLRWEDTTERDPAVVEFALDLSGMDPGLYRLRLSLTDRVTGRSSRADRLFRIDPAAPRVRTGG